MKIEKSCNVQGCKNVHEAKGWCKKHYMRFKRHGDVLFTRPSDWGSRERHPLYRTWNGLIRNHSAKGRICREWVSDFWAFVSDVVEKPSEGEYILTRKDECHPFSKENFYWRERKRLPPEFTKIKTEYAKKWRDIKKKSDPDFEFGNSLKKCYGITVDKYLEMHSEQNGKCAICNGDEKSVDRRTQKIRRMAVDHCHKTGKIRGLLCSSCNRGLGYFKDSIQSLQTAINYLGG